MSITLDPASFQTEGEYIEALSGEFLKSNNDDILAFARDRLANSSNHSLDTAIMALVWTVRERKTPTWKSLRSTAWAAALARFPIDRCNLIFIGLPA